MGIKQSQDDIVIESVTTIKYTGKRLEKGSKEKENDQLDSTYRPYLIGRNESEKKQTGETEI